VQLSDNQDFCKSMNINEFFGLKVREKRIALNLSQEKLANMADIDRTYLPGIENGKRNVSLAVAEKIAKALNVPLTKLLEDI
jgi:transcriptional regulator with XRE-family HTH domain